MGAEQGVGKFARSAIGGLAKIPWFAPFGMGFAERFVRRSLAQVTRYFTDETIHTAALESVFKLVGSNTKVLIGHSLGSVIAYEAVHLIKHRLPLLITLGSPLGLHTVVYERLRPQPPSFPPYVQRWVNVADQDDFIAAEPHLEALFGQSMPMGAVFEAGYTVDNGADPHNANFYLGKAQVGRPVGEIFNGERIFAP
jgi:pimeloyl-ACP methyl ester carboxylesterase